MVRMLVTGDENADQRMSVSVPGRVSPLVIGTQPITPVTPQLFFDRDIRNFGAVSGSGDAGLAILDAIADLPAEGGRIIIPAGLWLIETEVLVDRSNVQLVGGNGSILRKSTTDEHVIRLSGNATYCSVQGLEIDGDHQPEGALITINGSYNLVFNCFLHSNGVMADGPYANQSHGITLDGQLTTCLRNIIQSNRIIDCHDIGVSQHTTVDNRILDNTILENGLEGVTIDVQSHRAIVRGNLIAVNGIRGGVGNIGIDDSDLWIVDGNQIIAAQSGLSGIKTQNNVGPSNFGIINNNVILDNQGWGVWLFAGTSGNASNLTVNCNVVRGNVTGSIRLDAGSDNNQVRGNSLNGVAASNAGAGNTIN